MHKNMIGEEHPWKSYELSLRDGDFQLDDSVVSQFELARVFKNESGVCSMDFSWTGQHLAAATEDNQLSLLDCVGGKECGTWKSKKYGVDLPRFLSSENSVLFASRIGQKHLIGYWSLYDNRIVKFFQGHDAPVSSIAVNKFTDTFWSAGKDRNVFVWDIRAEKAQSKITLPLSGGVALAHELRSGRVLAIAGPPHFLRLYDLRNLESPFSSCELDQYFFEFSGAEFSPDGRDVVLTSQGTIFVVNTFDIDHTNPSSTDGIKKFSVSEEDPIIEASFTPDSKYVSWGSAEGEIHVYCRDSGREAALLSGHAGPVRVVKWSPTRALLASACSNVGFWIYPS